MLFGSSHIVLYLKRNSLEVYVPNKEGVQARLDFPPNFEKDQEIKDGEKFEQLISNFLTKLNLKDNNALIVLSGENLFEKTLPLTNPQDEQKLAEKFFAQIPFDPQKIAKKQIRTKNGVNLIAANKNLYEALVHVLQKLQVEIEAVVPQSMFGTTQASVLTKEDIKKIIASSNMVKETNFLTQDEEKPIKTDAEAAPEDAPKSKPNILLILGIIFIVLGLAFASLMYFKPALLNKYMPFVKNLKPQPSSLPAPQESPALEETNQNTEATDSSQTEEKSRVKVQVLNASGIVGQASTVKRALEALGFSQIETGNSTSQGETATKIIYSANVSQSLVDEIKAELEKTLGTITLEKAEEGNTFDVVITTGKPT